MKTFRYHGWTEGKTTMTAGELRTKLLEYPYDMPVFALWEGVYAPIQPSELRVERHDKCVAEDACDVLEIDVNSY